MFLKRGKFLGSVTVGERGQIVIPALARESLDIKAGDKLLVFQSHQRKALTIISAEDLAEFVARAMEHLSEFERTVTDELPKEADATGKAAENSEGS